jgi:anaerobic selenocysteine-containing dehydrogenase
MVAWKPTACILCECNCGLEVELGGDDGRRLVRLRGDKAHPASQGYACEKAHRLDYYQHSRDRIFSPLRRTPAGDYEPIAWDVALSEIAARLTAVRDRFGGASIFYYGGGGQGNHLPGAYATATRRALGSRYRSNALAQEKTGEFWVAGRMIGAYTRGDFEHCQVAMFLGKNPWHSHSFPHARTTLKHMARDPARTMIVVDPRRSETAAMADIHLQVRPGTDAWLLAAMVARIVQADLVDASFTTAHTQGLEAVKDAFGTIPVGEYAARAGIDEAVVARAVDVIAGAESFASYEDLGVQMNRHSTLVSYLHRLVWLLTGNFGKPGTHFVPTPLSPLLVVKDEDRRTPVLGERLVGGLVPCNVIAEEILTDHPDRYRAMIVEAANPAHSLADSQRFRAAMRQLDVSVVIDVAMTETARQADYVLPAATQFEKAEATFFNFDFPDNVFQLRHRLFAPPEGVRTEAEIHASLLEAMGAVGEADYAPLRGPAAAGRLQYAAAFMQHVLATPKAGLAAVIAYRTLGPVLPEGMAEAAVLLGAAFAAAMASPASLARAGFDGPPPMAAAKLFDAILAAPSGLVFARDRWEDTFARTSRARIELCLPDLLGELDQLREPPGRDRTAELPFTLSAGERRSFTANTIVRDPSWRGKAGEHALRIGPSDAATLGVASGDQVRLTTARGSAVVEVAVSDMMQPGHVSLPNGLGVGYPGTDGIGIAPNELTSVSDRDPFVGTPWHKSVAARVERV